MGEVEKMDLDRICPMCWTSAMLEMSELRCIRDVDFVSVADPGILACVIAYEVVHRFGPETGCFSPCNWAYNCIIGKSYMLMLPRVGVRTVFTL